MAAQKTLNIETPRWAKPLLQNARYKGAKGGRGSGKSHFFADEVIERSLREKCDIVCIREKQKSLKFSAKKLLETKIAKYGLSDYFTIQHDLIKNKWGNVIIFEGMANHTSDSIKSLEGFKYAWFEEAQNCSQLSLDLLLPTIRMENSEMWFSWNPRSEQDPIERLMVSDKKPKNSTTVHVNYDHNPWFPSTLRDEMEYMKRTDPDKYAHVWLGEYQKNSETRVFKNWYVEEFDAPSDAIFRQGADWGYSVDPTVLIRCFIQGRKLYVDYEAYRIGCEIVDIPDLFMQIPESEKWPLVADSARPETISHLRKNGFPKITHSVKGQKSVEEGVSWLQSFEIIVHPRCKHTIDELSTYSYKVDPNTDDVLPVLEDKNNHVIDALRYACEGVRRSQNKKNTQQFNILPMANKW